MKSIFSVLVGLVMFSAGPLLADYKELKQCGQVKILSGKTCEKAELEFSFEGCHLNSKPLQPKSVECNGNEGVARLGVDGHRYMGRIVVGQNQWGETSWVSAGALQQWVSDDILKATEVKAEPAREAASEPEAAATKVSGFLGARTTYIEGDLVNSGNQVFDGALYFEHSQGPAKVFIDVPFARNSASDANINFGQGQAQAYIAFSKNNMELMIGQFDTLYGFELNDAIDRTFTDAGLVFGKTLPTVHNGAAFSYKKEGFTGKLLAANNRDQGAQNDVAAEYGLQLGYSVGDKFYITAGYLAHNEEANDKTKSLTDILLGTKFGPVAIDVQYDIVKDDPNNTESSATGLMVHTVWSICDHMSAALRLEQVEKFTGAFKAKQGSIGATWKVTDYARVQFDLTEATYEVTDGADETSASGGNLAFLYKF